MVATSEPGGGRDADRGERPDPVVYVVDDDLAVRDSLTVLLEVHGFTVEPFASTAEFARAFRRPMRGCVVLDQHLPVTSGLDFLTSPMGRALGLPVILISGRADDNVRARAKEVGVRFFLEKPLASDELIALIRHAVGDKSY